VACFFRRTAGAQAKCQQAADEYAKKTIHVFIIYFCRLEASKTAMALLTQA
jgi:hypothetical protein